MSGIEKLNELMNAVRGVTGNTAKMSLDKATTALNKAFKNHGYAYDVDLDNMKESGIYTLHLSKKFASQPEEGWGIVTVVNPSGTTSNDFIKQEWVSDNTGNVFVRICARGQWRAWKKLGGIINPVLSAFRRIVTPLMGGVAYVA